MKLHYFAFSLSLFLIGAMPNGMAEPSTQKEALVIVKNPLAGIPNRLKAMEQLKSNLDSHATDQLLTLVRNPDEPIVLRARLIEVLVSSQDAWVDIELHKMLNNSTLASETRKLALYALWKKNPQKMKEKLIGIAQNGRDPADLRVQALGLLRQAQDAPMPAFWEKLYTIKANPAPIRIAALNGMEELEFLGSNQTKLFETIQNPRENTEVRKSTILAAWRTFSQTVLEEEFLKILSNPENSLEIKRLAIDNLASSGNRLLLPKLKQILLQEKNETVADELRGLIETLSNSA